jgi:hypothetical protein
MEFRGWNGGRLWLVFFCGVSTGCGLTQDGGAQHWDFGKDGSHGKVQVLARVWLVCTSRKLPSGSFLLQQLLCTYLPYPAESGWAVGSVIFFLRRGQLPVLRTYPYPSSPCKARGVP